MFSLSTECQSNGSTEKKEGFWRILALLLTTTTFHPHPHEPRGKRWKRIGLCAKDSSRIHRDHNGLYLDGQWIWLGKNISLECPFQTCCYLSHSADICGMGRGSRIIGMFCIGVEHWVNACAVLFNIVVFIVYSTLLKTLYILTISNMWYLFIQYQAWKCFFK